MANVYVPTSSYTVQVKDGGNREFLYFVLSDLSTLRLVRNVWLTSLIKTLYVSNIKVFVLQIYFNVKYLLITL